MEVSITYELDGKEISPEELAGKSGHVTMRFEYTNKETYRTMVDGVEKEVAVPFAVVSGMMLPTDHFKNVTVTNGRCVSEGNNQIVLGLAMPGLSDSLNLDDLKLEEGSGDTELSFPECIEVEADVQDFELEMTMTLVMNHLLSSLLEEANMEVPETSGTSDELADASTQLKDGSQSLLDGIVTLDSKTGELVSGVNVLGEGIFAYTDGVASLADGADQLQNGLVGAADRLFRWTTEPVNWLWGCVN